MKMKVARVNISITKLLKEAEEFTGGKGKKPVGDEKAFDPSEPRDEQGQWTDGGGDGNSAESVSESGGGRYSSPSAKEFIDARDKSGDHCGRS